MKNIFLALITLFMLINTSCKSKTADEIRAQREKNAYPNSGSFWDCGEFIDSNRKIPYPSRRNTPMPSQDEIDSTAGHKIW